MARGFLHALGGLLLGAVLVSAQPTAHRSNGTLRKVDPMHGVVTVTVDNSDQDFLVTGRTQIRGPDGRPLQIGLEDPRFHEGAAVQIVFVRQRGQAHLLRMHLLGNAQAPPRVDTSALLPLTEMGTRTYKRYPGGLYPGGRNHRPAAHEAAGLALARQVQPLDSAGRPDPDGCAVLLSVGMSNTTKVFSTFKRLADADPAKNPHLVIIDGAQGGMAAARIVDAQDGSFGEGNWTEVDRRLAAAGVTRSQVQIAWIKEADRYPTQTFPQDARKLEVELAQIVQLMRRRFPNLKLVYLSSRTYAGYARTLLNPEPYAYESGFAVKWLIEQQIKGDPAVNYDPARGKVWAPWLSWGPYLWANGTTRRADGLYYTERDFAEDGTHPSARGAHKIAGLLLQFFKTDSTTRPWFLAR